MAGDPDGFQPDGYQPGGYQPSADSAQTIGSVLDTRRRLVVGASDLLETSKRVSDKVTISFDWHDYLICERVPGALVAVDYAFRPPRALATGWQYKCTVAGVVSSRPFGQIRWPRTLGAIITDGGVTWQAQAIGVASLRGTIDNQVMTPDTGVTITGQADSDMIYSGILGGGSNGGRFDIVHKVTLSTLEEKEAVIRVEVIDR